jgi:hypothetical protein
MSGEDPWNPGLACWDFRIKCQECGKQIQFVGGRRVQPDCGHELAALRVEMGDES